MERGNDQRLQPRTNQTAREEGNHPPARPPPQPRPTHSNLVPPKMSGAAAADYSRHPFTSPSSFQGAVGGALPLRTPSAASGFPPTHAPPPHTSTSPSSSSSSSWPRSPAPPAGRGGATSTFAHQQPQPQLHHHHHQQQPARPLPSTGGLSNQYDQRVPPQEHHHQLSTTSSTSASSVQTRPSVPPQKHAGHSTSDINFAAIRPIRVLNPYVSGWAIKVRCTWRGEMRHYTSRRNDRAGCVFSANFVDADGTSIAAAFFDDGATRYVDVLKEGSIFYVARGTVKYSRRGREGPTQSEYELNLNEESVVIEMDDDSSIPRQTYAFVSIQSLTRLPPTTPADVIGVIVTVGSLENKASKTGVGVVPRLKISLADESGHCVGLAIWGGKASKLHADLVSNGRGQVIAVKGAKVFRWNEGEGVSLTAWETCAVGLNPDIAQTAALVGWWNERGGSTAALHSVGPPISHPSPESEEREGTLADLQRCEERGEAGLWRVEATVQMIRRELPLWYPACPFDRCGKKVEWLNMQWNCHKCQTLYEAPDYRYIANIRVADHTGSHLATCFNEVGTTLFGVEAKQIAEWESAGTKEAAQALAKCLDSALFRRFEFKVRVAPSRGKSSIVSATPIVPTNRAPSLVASIERLLQLPPRPPASDAPASTHSRSPVRPAITRTHGTTTTATAALPRSPGRGSPMMLHGAPRRF